MTIKQILIAFWWIIAIAVIVISGLKINSLKFEVKPHETAKDVAILVNRINNLDMKAEVTYYLEKNTDIKLSENQVNFFSKGIVIEGYPVLNKNVKAIKKENGVILTKDG